MPRWGRVPAPHDHPCPLADSECITVKQYPRYVGAKKNTPIQFICYFEDPHSIQWYKLVEGSDEFYELGNSSSRYSVQTTNKFTSFTISSITYEDNGIYVCDRKNLTAEQQRPHDCGTQLKVLSEWELPILSAPQEMLLPLSLFPPPCEPHTMLLCTHISPCWWDPFRYNCRCSMAPQGFLCSLPTTKGQENLHQFALAHPSCRKPSQGLRSPNKAGLPWSWLEVGTAQGVSSQSWSLMAVCSGLVSPNAESFSPLSPPICSC